MTPKLPGWVVVFTRPKEEVAAMIWTNNKLNADRWAEHSQDRGFTIIAVCPAADLAKLDTRKERERDSQNPTS